MRRRVPHVLLLLLGGLPLAIAACGLVSGLDDLHVGDSEGGADAVPDVPAEAAGDDGGSTLDASLDVGSCEGGSCNAPVGFQPVLFASDRNTACTGATDVVVDPSPALGSTCQCTCNTTAATAVCLPQPQIISSTSFACSASANVPVALDGGCNSYNQGLSTSNASVGPFPLLDGGCTSKLNASGTVASTSGRLCPVASCAACQAPAGYQLCYFAAGAATCPNGMTAHTIASTATFACSACTCAATGSCRGTLQTYSNLSCGNFLDALPVDGTCRSLKGSVIRSFQYTPSANLTGCTAGSSAAGVSLTAQGTVCCPP